MEVSYFKIVFRYSAILILAMFCKVIAISPLSNSDNTILRYEEIEIVNENYSYKKPEFNSTRLNDFVNTYIEKNSCTTFEYNIFEVEENTVSIYLNCGTPEYIIYNYMSGEEFKFEHLVKSSDNFINSVRRLLNLKYPKFVTEEVSVLNGIYKIYENELVGYFNTQNYGSVSVKINNNEIKDLMTYDMDYDDAYENEVYTLDKNKKTIAFTFDDGPSYYDLEIIDYLTDSHSSATFFLVGNRINSYKDSVLKMIDTNMEVGNHSYSHKVMTKLGNSKITEELTMTNETFKNLTGKDMNLFRAPYGAINSRVLLTTKMSSILWSVDTLDWQSRDADKVYNAIMSSVKDGDIVLMHSLYKSTAEAVKKVIPELYKQGYQIVSVSKLFELKDRNLEIGQSYTNIP